MPIVNFFNPVSGSSFTASSGFSGPKFTGGTFAGSTVSGTTYTAASGFSGPAHTGATFVGQTVQAGTGFSGPAFTGGTFAGSTVSGTTITGQTYQAITSFQGTTVGTLQGQVQGGTFQGQSITTSGTIQAAQTISSQTGDVIAYASDDRLKNRIMNIQGALEKVGNLNGFLYTFNDLGRSFGFDGEQHVGVSAQEIQKVLPEVVKPAPFDLHFNTGNNYVTVQYEKIVPLLIEAIKELNDNLQTVIKRIDPPR